jgi:hypothetical protein
MCDEGDVGMWSVWVTGRKDAAVVLLTLMTAGACAQRANQPLPPVPAPAAALAAPAPQPVQPTYSRSA